MLRPTDAVDPLSRASRPATMGQIAAPPRDAGTTPQAAPSAPGETAQVSVEGASQNVADAKTHLMATLTRNAGAGAEPRGETGTSEVASYRKLIAEDIKTAYGREATDEDYTYWLEKLQGPNDSGFVTSGKMGATEYWHRRMLGWQAGGSDVALHGPYAGGGGPHGDVPAATDIVPTVPPGGIYNTASPERIDEIKRIIDGDLRLAYGRTATEEDYGYWLHKFLGVNDSGFVTGGHMSSDEYWHRRLLGWQAGGADAPTSGPFAYSDEDTGRPIPPVDIYKAM